MALHTKTCYAICREITTGKCTTGVPLSIGGYARRIFKLCAHRDTLTDEVSKKALQEHIDKAEAAMKQLKADGGEPHVEDNTPPGEDIVDGVLLLRLLPKPCGGR